MASAPPKAPNAMGRARSFHARSGSTLREQLVQKTERSERRASQAAQEGGLSASASAVRRGRRTAGTRETTVGIRGPSTQAAERLRSMVTKGILFEDEAEGSRP